MNHRKVYSQGSIPFSWEDSPGVSKVIHKEYTIDLGLNAVNTSSPTSPILFPRDSDTSYKVLGSHGIKIPLPPCVSAKIEPPRRSKSVKGFRWWQEDPFLAAYKECTKNARNGKLLSESKKNVRSKLRKSMASYPTKEASAQSPTSPPSPPSPLPPPPPTPVPPPPSPQPSDCGDFSYCPSDETCCCILNVFDYCLVYGCCAYENAVCCADSEYCCPRDYPICDVEEGLCLKGQGDYLGVAASKRHMAKHKFPWTKLQERTKTDHRALQWKRNPFAAMR